MDRQRGNVFLSVCISYLLALLGAVFLRRNTSGCVWHINYHLLHFIQRKVGTPSPPLKVLYLQTVNLA